MELLLSPIVFGPLCLLIGAFIGIGLGRRSTTANQKYDELRAKYNELRDRYENKG